MKHSEILTCPARPLGGEVLRGASAWRVLVHGVSVPAAPWGPLGALAVFLAWWRSFVTTCLLLTLRGDYHLLFSPVPGGINERHKAISDFITTCIARKENQQEDVISKKSGLKMEKFSQHHFQRFKCTENLFPIIP